MRFNKLSLSWRLIPVLLLAGCTGNLQQLKDISPVANDFPSSLAAEYLAYSESEIEQKRDSSADYFAAKGVDAAKGGNVEPDRVSNDSPNFKKLTQSRAALMEALTEGAKKLAPQKAARAQLLFDCWNEQESKKISMQKISCEKEFAIAYDELRDVADDITYGADSKNTVEFVPGNADLGGDEMLLIKAIAAHLSGYSDYAVQLDAHLDGKDIKSKQLFLMNKRIAVLKSSLIKAGIPKKKIFIAKPSAKKPSQDAVHLSNDDDMQSGESVDIIVTSPRHLLTVPPND